MKLTWHSRELKQAVTAALVGNGEIVGKFLETEAKRRLLGAPGLTRGEPRIVDGQRYTGQGAVYRGYVASLITSNVEADGNGVTIAVGVGPGRGGTHHGLYIELGSRNNPASPFLRPAVFENGGKIVALLAGK